MFTRYRSAAVAAVALLAISTAVFAAGSYSTLPIVGGASFCASTVSGTGSLGGATGQGQGTSGSICAQTIPAGPPILTGTELVPADTGLAGGASPQTVVIPMASLNALPILVSTIPTNVTATLSATNLQGGVIFHSTATVTAATVSLPPSPIDGQQYAITADRTITTLIVTATTAGQAITNAPTTIVSSVTAPFGYRFLYNLALNTWLRLQ